MSTNEIEFIIFIIAVILALIVGYFIGDKAK